MARKQNKNNKFNDGPRTLLEKARADKKMWMILAIFSIFITMVLCTGLSVRNAQLEGCNIQIEIIKEYCSPTDSNQGLMEDEWYEFDEQVNDMIIDCTVITDGETQSVYMEYHR